MGMPGVIGVMVINQDGVAIRSTLSEEETLKYGAHISQMVTKSRKIMQELGVEEGDGGVVNSTNRATKRKQGKLSNDLAFIRIRTLNHEVLVSPCGQ